MPTEFAYVALLFALFVIPRLLQRIRVPGAITCLLLGIVAGVGMQTVLGQGIFQGDATIELLAVFGITSLFLFAGLEIDFKELRGDAVILGLHVLTGLLLLFGFSVAAHQILNLTIRASVLLALALLTPSAGFILESIERLGLDKRERFWVKSKVIASELAALGALFVVLQSNSWQRLGIASLALTALVIFLPLIFRFFADWIVPHAPRSEFAFLLIVATLAALATKMLGVYYLVGAFLVGLAARRFEERLPALTSENMLHAIEFFASLFIPFYFFSAGLHLTADQFGWPALLTGVVFLIVALPIRTGAILVHRRLLAGENWRQGMRIGGAMLPTLVFTLVLAGILHQEFQVAPYIFGGLIFYALVNTVLPVFLFKIAPPEYESVYIPGLPKVNVGLPVHVGEETEE